MKFAFFFPFFTCEVPERNGAKQATNKLINKYFKKLTNQFSLRKSMQEKHVTGKSIVAYGGVEAFLNAGYNGGF